MADSKEDRLSEKRLRKEVSGRIRRAYREILWLRSQGRFADLIGVPRTTVTSWLKGAALPSARHLIAMAEKANLNPRWVLRGEGPERCDANMTEGEADIAIREYVRSLFMQWSREGGASEETARIFVDRFIGEEFESPVLWRAFYLMRFEQWVNAGARFTEAEGHRLAKERAGWFFQSMLPRPPIEAAD